MKIKNTPNYFLPHHTTFGQTQTGATVHLRGIEKLLKNAQIALIPTGQMFLLAGCDKKSRK
jgi:hypothetical protein